IMQWDQTIDATGRRALLQEAYESSDRLLSLVESQLIIAKLETRHFEPTPEAVDLASAMGGVLAVLNHRYAERTAAVKVQLPENLPPAFCESAHLGQVLSNLIGNALEYTTGSVEVEARQLQRAWLEVTVSDHGQGLSAGHLETVFDKTGPAGRSRSQGGLGLGLYLCHLVVERSFGGRIWVASSDRRGRPARSVSGWSTSSASTCSPGWVTSSARQCWPFRSLRGRRRSAGPNCSRACSSRRKRWRGVPPRSKLRPSCRRTLLGASSWAQSSTWRCRRLSSGCPRRPPWSARSPSWWRPSLGSANGSRAIRCTSRPN